MSAYFSHLICSYPAYKPFGGIKGLAEELAQTGMRWYIYDIPRFFGEEFFETKKVHRDRIPYPHSAKQERPAAGRTGSPPRFLTNTH